MHSRAPVVVLLLLVAAVVGSALLLRRGEPAVAPAVDEPVAEPASGIERGGLAPSVDAAGGNAAAAEREAVAGAGEGDRSQPGILGQVVGEDGAPIAGAEVQCMPGFGAGSDLQDLDPATFEGFDPAAFAARLREGLAQRVVATTDADGRFRLRPPGSGRNVPLRVLAKGHPVLDRTVARPVDADTDVGVLTLETGAVLQGRVVDPRGNPIEGARVARLEGFEQGMFGFDVAMPGLEDFEDLRGEVAVSDAAGGFELAHLPAGEFALRARHTERPSARSATLTLAKGQRLEGVLVTMSPGAEIRGVVAGIPAGVTNVRVMASARREPPANEAAAGLLGMVGDPAELMADLGVSIGERQVDPAADGSFVFRGLEQGTTYRLWAVQQGRGFVGGGECSPRLEVLSGAQNVELRYEAGVTVTFAVVAADGTPVERLWVQDRLRGGGGLGDLWGGAGGPGSRSRPGDYPGGKVTIANLRPKSGQKLQLTVEALGFESWRREGIELPGRGVLDLGTVPLAAAPVLSIEVLAADTGEPIAGARVRVSGQVPTEARNDPLAAMARSRGGAGPTSAQTDAKGRCELNARTDGPGLLRITAKDFAPARIELPTGARGEQLVKLVVGGTIEVVVLDAEQKPVANAVVEHRSPSGDTDERRTDAQGMARFANQTPGPHELRLAADGGPMRFARRIEGMGQLGGATEPAAWIQVAVVDRETVRASLVRSATARLSGVVRENGVALAGARVSFVAGAGDADGGGAAVGAALQGVMERFAQGGSTQARTGDDGAFALSELPAGQHRLRVTHPSRAMPTEVAVALALGDNRVDVELDMTSLRGVVLDPDGRPVDGARVAARVAAADEGADMLAAVEGMAPGMGLGGPSQRTDSSGAFELRGVQPGAALEVRATTRGFAPAVLATTVARGESKAGLELRLLAAGKIAVTVASGAGPFAMVQARWVGESGPSGAPVVQMLRRGKGTLGDLRPGTWEVEYRSMQDGASGQGKTARVEVRAGETATVAFD